MVRVLSLALPLLVASQALAAYYAPVLIGRDVDIAPRHVSTVASVQASLSIDVELEASADVFIGLGNLNAGFGLDVDVSSGGLHMGLDLGLNAHLGLSLDLCLRAFLAKVVLTLDGHRTCSAPSMEVLKQPLQGKKSIPCSCSDPNVSLVLLIPDISLDVEASATLIAQQELHFVLERLSTSTDIIVSKPKVQWPEPKKCKLGYEKSVKC